MAHEPGRKQWGDPVAMPTLAKSPSVTAVVTEGKDLLWPLQNIHNKPEHSLLYYSTTP